MLNNEMKEELMKGLPEIFSGNIVAIILYGSKFICWSADLDLQYERVFSIIDILEKNLQKWGKVLPFYQNMQKEGIVLWKAA